MTDLLDGAVLVDGEIIITQLGPPCTIDQDVRGLDVPMDNTVCVQELQPVRHIPSDSHLNITPCAVQHGAKT